MPILPHIMDGGPLALHPEGQGPGSNEPEAAERATADPLEEPPAHPA